MKTLHSIRRFLTYIFLFALTVQCGQAQQDTWAEDFNNQPVSGRPSLEVNYTDASRTAFQVLAEEYNVTGQLEDFFQLGTQ